jgi:hypothetical protein
MLASLRSTFTSLLARGRKKRAKEEFHALVDTTQTSLENIYLDVAGMRVSASDLKNINFTFNETPTDSTGETTIFIRSMNGKITYRKNYTSLIHAQQDLVALHELRQTQRQSISALLINERTSKLVVVSIVLAVALISEGVVDGFAMMIKSWSTLLVIGFGVLVFVDNLLLRFRARRGMFGNTEYEAREIIAFILRNADSLDDGDSPRRIFDPEQSEESLIMEGYGVGAHP